MKRRYRFESARRHFWRRAARRKLHVPKVALDAEPKDIRTHDDVADLQNYHGLSAAYVAQDEADAHATHEELGVAEADDAASEEELHALLDQQGEEQKRRAEYVGRVVKAGLGHLLVRQRRFVPIVVLTIVAAVFFETTSLATPASLVSALDFGFSQHTQERLGAILALVLALAYAVVLATIGKRAGSELRREHHRDLLEAEHADDDTADDRPLTTGATTAKRMIWTAVGSGVAALLGASLIREVAVQILVASDSNTASVPFYVFLLLTGGIFVALVAAGYWSSNPLGKTLAEIDHGLAKRQKQIDAKRRESYRNAARVETSKAKLTMIDARNQQHQHVALHLTLRQLAWRAGHNSHIYGVKVNPKPIQAVIDNPGDHVRDMTLPSIERGLIKRIQEIRDRVVNARDTSGEDETDVHAGKTAEQVVTDLTEKIRRAETESDTTTDDQSAVNE